MSGEVPANATGNVRSGMPPVHPAADEFPLIEGEEFSDLVADIKANGQREPCWMWRGQLLDGRNRWRACAELGIAPKTRDFTGDETAAIDLVVSLNIKRRHLDDTQRKCIAVALEALFAKALAEKKGAALAARRGPDGKVNSAPKEGNSPQLVREPQARDLAARAVNVEPRGVQDAKRVLRDAPDIFALAKSGKVNMSEAKKLAALPEPDRKEAVAAVEQKRARNVTAAVQEVKTRRAREELAAKAKDVTEIHAHRVLCGDAVEQLRQLPDKSAHCCITDPPYGIDTHRTRKGGHDYADGDEYALKLLDDVCTELARVLTDDAHLYVFSGYTHVQSFKEIIGKHFEVQDNPIIWVKDRHTMCDFSQWYASKHEYVIFARRGSKRPLAAKCSVDVIECAREPGPHSAAKPTALLRQLVENSTVPGETVIDPFVGSGRTMQAAKACGRNSIGIELDPPTAAAAQGSVA